MSQTTAERVADLLENNGDQFVSVRGLCLADECGWHGATHSWRDYGTIERRRFVFGDGSALTVVQGMPPHGDRSNAWWDLGYADCYCWDSEGHILPDCPRRGGA